MTQSKPQNPPKKHHYIPEFYQKKWALEDKIIVFMRHNGIVRARKKSPASTGYVELLYSMNELPKSEVQMIEAEYMSPVDSLAALARDALIAQRPLTSRERLSWVQFMMSLQLRTPEEIALFKESYREQGERLKSARSEQYLQGRVEGDPETFDDYLRMIGPAGIEKAMMHLFLQMMSNKNIATIMNGMRWTSINVKSASHKLMTSDRPLVMPYGLGRADAYIAMPLSPDKLFLATKKNDLIESEMKRRGSNGIVADINAAVVGQSYKYVYAADDSQLRFVQNRMAKLPRYSLIQRLLNKFEKDDNNCDS